MKKITEQQKIENKLRNNLRNCLSELESGSLDEEVILGYFSQFLLDA